MTGSSGFSRASVAESFVSRIVEELSVLPTGPTQRVLLLGWLTLITLVASPARGTELKPQTIAAFDDYVRLTESRMADDLHENRFLAIDGLPEAERQQAY